MSANVLRESSRPCPPLPPPLAGSFSLCGQKALEGAKTSIFLKPGGAQHPEALVQFPRAPEVKRTGAHGRSSPSPDFALVSSQGSNRRLPAFQKVRARGRIISSNRTMVYHVQRLTHKHPPTHTWVLPIVPGYGQSYIFPGFQIKNLKQRGEACPSSSRWREPRRPAPRPHPFGPAVLGVAISVGGSQYSCAC